MTWDDLPKHKDVLAAKERMAQTGHVFAGSAQKNQTEYCDKHGCLPVCRVASHVVVRPKGALDEQEPRA